MDAESARLRAEFWKGHLLSPATPRTGDKAAVTKNHGCGAAAQESGLLVRVVNAPVLGTIYCEHCGGRVDEWVVEVVLIDHLGRDLHEGVYAYPVKWLQRVLPLGTRTRRRSRSPISAG
jgi:hypothetical protein